jgi:alkyl sulfatase BDS1-like metallo-beta-lactamase superfamily hydrolase
VSAGRIPVIAPDGFTEAVGGENVLAGLPMARRAQYQFGILLPTGEVSRWMPASAKGSRAANRMS